jgi:sec-independent protein translocase protein TatA
MGIGDLFDSPWKVLIIAVVVLVLFGSKKLPDAARSLGRSMRILKKEVSTLHNDDDEEEQPAGAAPAAVTATPAAAAPAPAPITHQTQVDELQRQINELRSQAPAAAEPQQTHQAH